MIRHVLSLILSCGLLWMTISVDAMSTEDVELQTRLLESIFETVKDRQPSKGGELNLMTNESAGFAASVRSFCEKGIYCITFSDVVAGRIDDNYVSLTGAPAVRNGNRVSTFNLTKLSDPESTQILMQLAVKVPRLDYFSCVKSLHLMLANSHGNEQPVGSLILTEEDKSKEWLQITIRDCENCHLQKLEMVEFVLQLRDDNQNHVNFTEDTATDLKSFLILYSQKSLFPVEPSQPRQKREESETPTNQPPSIEALLENRTTLSDLRERDVACSRQQVLLTQEEILYRHTIIAPHPGAIKFSYCYGECSIRQQSPFDEGAPTDRRTRLMTFTMHHLDNEPGLFPHCVPHDMNSTMLVIAGEDMVKLGTFPNVVNCKCQL